MKCLNCDADVKETDNFCYKCGHFTSKGYTFLKNQDNVNLINKGKVVKQNKSIVTIMISLSITIILFVSMSIIKGSEFFKPYYYLKKYVYNYLYGYNISIINTNMQYKNIDIDDYEDAIYMVYKDFDSQNFKCYNNVDVNKLEYLIEDKYDIKAINLCDVSYDTALEISNLIDRIYLLFPNIKGSLTDISIANPNTNKEYVAKFEPKYTFVNSTYETQNYAKVNKTQILLSSYYFLNNKDNEINNIDMYVKDASKISIIAHEFGHYISFKLLLKEYNLDSVVYQDTKNEELINQVMDIYQDGSFSKELVENAINNYNVNNNTFININDFSKMISNYAYNNGNIIYDEIIAEAVHDYYLHGNGMSSASLEIINIILGRLS